MLFLVSRGSAGLLQKLISSWPPGCDEGTWENKKDGGTLVEELETPIVDADLKVGKQSWVITSDFYT